MPIANQCDPQLRLQHIRIRLRDAIEHLRADVRDIEEPELRWIFATSAEVLGGLVAALDDYEQDRGATRRGPPRLRRSG